MWRAGVYNVQLVEAVIREALLHLEDFSQQNLANLVSRTAV